MTKPLLFYEKILFFIKFLKKPKQIGAVIPSSRFLAQAITKLVLQNNPRKIIELGPGTGILTKHLLEGGISPQQLVLIEKDESFIPLLKKKFPNITIIHGDALQLSKLTKKYNLNIDLIVSSLPINSFSEKVAKKILKEIETNLPKGGQYIQYYYLGFNFNKNIFPKNFLLSKKQIIWANIPPAVITLTRKG